MEIYTDGGCSPNPGPGGWGMCVFDSTKKCVLDKCGHNPNTTNNRMELAAFIAGLEHAILLGAEVECTLFTDSSYCVQGYTQWLSTWIARSWQRSDGGKVLNLDLWPRVAQLQQTLNTYPHFNVKHVRGHNGNVGNERADRLANKWRTHQAAETLLQLTKS